MLSLDNFKVLHRSMRDKNIERVIFPFCYNNKHFSCILDVAKTPYSLYVTTCKKDPVTFDFEVNIGYLIEEKLKSEDYKNLCKYLELEYDPNYPFKTQYFLSKLNAYIPVKCNNMPSYCQLLEAASYISGKNIEESKKNYFLKWRHNSIGTKVTAKNLEKTLIAFGEEKKNIMEARNISSCWTAYKSEENIISFDGIFKQ